MNSIQDENGAVRDDSPVLVNLKQPMQGERDDVVVSVRGVGKMYRLYDQPRDRLKHAFFARFGKKYGRHFWALQNVSFEVRRGERIGVIGRNGAGKSTLLQILAGVLTPTTGEVRVAGRTASFLQLGSGFNPEFTGRENVFLNGALLGLSRTAMEERFEKIATFADIGDFINQPVKKYSSGMSVRLAFAISTVLEPDVLFVDEVLAVGDVFFKQKCYKRLEELVARGTAVVFVSHAMNEVEQFCQRALLLHDGAVAFQGSASEAVKRYYLIEQEGGARSVTEQPSLANSKEKAPSEAVPSIASPPAVSWPPPEAFLNIAKITQVANGWARCTGVALCDAQGKPCRAFQQGETASFFYEFELLHNIEVPIGGIVIQDNKGTIVHGKNSLQYEVPVPQEVKAGRRVRFRQDIGAEVAIGEYTVEVGLAAIRREDYQRRGQYTHPELNAKCLRLCHLPAVTSFAIVVRRQGAPTSLLHHGLANLPGNFRVAVVEPAPSLAPVVKRTPVSAETHPTIFHLTHQKAGSQWLHKIFLECAPGRIVAPQVKDVQFLQTPLQEGRVYPTVYITKEEFESVVLPSEWRRFVVIRDLRDTMVSAYFSMKVSHPVSADLITELRTRLQSISVEDGLMFILEQWLPRCAAIQMSWWRAGERLIRYEDLLTNDVEILAALLIDEGQLPISRPQLRKIVEKNRFETVTGGRARGQEDVAAHERKGIAGDWRNFFTDKIKQRFKERYGEVLITTGYEEGLDW